MQRVTDRPSVLGRLVSSALNEAREIAWLVVVVAALSVLGIVVAVSLSFALDRHFSRSGQDTIKTAHCSKTANN